MNAPKVPNVDGDWQSIDIFLFSNGQQYSPPRKYHLRSEELNWWDATLNNLAREHYGIQHPLIILYTTNGQKVEGPLDLRDGMAYVAVEPPDPFIDAGYEKYLIRATRSWEKRQAKKASPEDITCASKPACEHAQPCCYCPERECVVAVESEHTEFITTKQCLQAPDENCMNAVPAVIGPGGTWPCEFGPRMGLPEDLLGEIGAQLSVSRDHPGEHRPIPGEYVRPVVTQPCDSDRGQRVIDHGPRLDESKARMSDGGARPGEHRPRSGDYESRPGEYGLRLGEYKPKTAEYGSRPGEYGLRPGEYGSRPGEYGPKPVEYRPKPGESGPWIDEYESGSRSGHRESRSGDTGTRLEKYESKIDSNYARLGEHDRETIEDRNRLGEYGVRPDKYGGRPCEYGNRPGDNGGKHGEGLERTSEYYKGRSGEFSGQPDEYESRNNDRSGRAGESNSSRVGQYGGKSSGQRNRGGGQAGIESEQDSKGGEQGGKGTEYEKRETVHEGTGGEKGGRGSEKSGREGRGQSSGFEQGGARGVEYSRRGPEQSNRSYEESDRGPAHGSRDVEYSSRVPEQNNRRYEKSDRGPAHGSRGNERGNREDGQSHRRSDQNCTGIGQGSKGADQFEGDDSQNGRNYSQRGKEIEQSHRESFTGSKESESRGGGHRARGGESGGKYPQSDHGSRGSELGSTERGNKGSERGIVEVGRNDKGGRQVDLVRRSAEYTSRASERGGRGGEQVCQGNERERRECENGGRSGELGTLVENGCRAVENTRNEGRCTGRVGDYENLLTELATSDAMEQRATGVESRDTEHRRSRGAESGIREGGIGASGVAAFSYISEAQQHVRRSSVSTTKPSTVNKTRLLGSQHPTFKKPTPDQISPAPQRRPDVAKPLRSSRETPPKRAVGKASARVTNGAAAVSHVSGKSKTLPKHPTKRFAPTAVPPPTANFDQSTTSRKSTSLTKITQNNKSLATDSAPVENVIDDKEIIVVSTNLLRNKESEMQSMRLDTLGRILTDVILDSCEETQTEQISFRQSITSIPVNEEVQTHSNKINQEPNTQEYGVSSSRHMTQSSSRVRVNHTTSVQQDNMVATDDPNDENYIAIINKGDVVNLKLNIEVRNAERAFNTTTSQKTTRKSRSLTNVVTTEKGSQISIEEMLVQSKSLQSILNNEYLRGSGFQGRPKVVVVQCACCGPKNCINPSRFSTTPPSYNDKKYFVLLSDSQREDITDRCNCDPTFKQSQYPGIQPQLKKHSVSLPLKKTVSNISIEERITVRDRAFACPKNDMSMFVATTNSTSQTEDARNENVMTKQNVNITQNQSSGPCAPCAPCGQLSFPRKSYSQTSIAQTQFVTTKTSYERICPPVAVIDSLTQTEWCDVLLEARRHENGRYSFHLPPLHVLRYYTF